MPLQQILDFLESKLAPPGFAVAVGTDAEVDIEGGQVGSEGRLPQKPVVRKSMVWRSVGAILLVVTPLIAYWPTIFHYYGLRDSYSNLREAHEEPGKLVQFCASHARPIYGWLLQITLSRIDTIHELQWIRLLSAVLLGAVSLATYKTLRRTGWSAGLSLLMSLWLGLLPSAQVIAGWAIGWPYSLAVLVALAAFYFADRGFRIGTASISGMLCLGFAVVLIATSGLIYQPNALFYVVPVTAGFLVRRSRKTSEDVRWVLGHVSVVCSGLAIAFGFMQVCYAEGIFHQSARIAFEKHWLEKLFWFLDAPVPNSLSFYVINDDHHFDRSAYLAGAAIAGVLIILGGFLELRRWGGRRWSLWLLALLSFPVLGFAVNLVAAERYATYRTIFALTAILMCFLLTSVRAALSHVDTRLKRLLSFSMLFVALLVARSRAHALLAVPQGNEWKIVLDGAARVDLSRHIPSVFAIEPTPDDISTTTIYHDEFGSLSSNSDWVPKEMFKRAIHDLHPNVPNLDHEYRFESGTALPKDERFDVVIDLRTLKSLKTDD